MEVISFILGGLLVLIGIIGGGFEIKEARIPKVGWPSRLMAVVAGVFFIGLGLGIAHPSQPQPPTPQPPASQSPVQGQQPVVPSQPLTPQPAQPVRFMIHDELGDMQVMEEMTVVLNGRVVGTLAVDERRPNSSLTVTVPRAGEYRYTVEGAAIFEVQGRTIELPGAGQGAIHVEHGKNFRLAGSFSGDNWFISLIED